MDAPAADALEAPEVPLGAPGRTALAGEALTPLQLGRLVIQAPQLARAPRGTGGIVIDIPGWRSPEASALLLRRYLTWLGHDARAWGLGSNSGDPRDAATDLTEIVRALERERDAPVALIGWSLGGVVAREVARLEPGLVSRVITYGTPVVGGPAHTIAAGSYSDEQIADISALVEERETASPVQVPITAIYSKRDGIVDWRACIDRCSPDVENIRVGSPHLGMGIDPDIWRLIAERLA